MQLESCSKDVPILCLFVPTRKWSTDTKSLIVNGGDDGTRTRGLCRDSISDLHSRGGCQVAERDCRNRSLWVSLWVRIFALQRLFETDYLGVGTKLRSGRYCQVSTYCDRTALRTSPMMLAAR